MAGGRQPVNLKISDASFEPRSIAVWAVMIVMYALTARALLRGQRALHLYMLAFTAELVRWVPMYLLPAYVQTWTSGDLRFRYIAWVVLSAVGAAIGWAERNSVPNASGKAR